MLLISVHFILANVFPWINRYNFALVSFVGDFLPSKCVRLTAHISQVRILKLMGSCFKTILMRVNIKMQFFRLSIIIVGKPKQNILSPMNRIALTHTVTQSLFLQMYLCKKCKSVIQMSCNYVESPSK